MQDHSTWTSVEINDLLWQLLTGTAPSKYRESVMNMHVKFLNRTKQNCMHIITL